MKRPTLQFILAPIAMRTRVPLSRLSVAVPALGGTR